MANELSCLPTPVYSHGNARGTAGGPVSHPVGQREGTPRRKGRGGSSFPSLPPPRSLGSPCGSPSAAEGHLRSVAACRESLGVKKAHAGDLTRAFLPAPHLCSLSTPNTPSHTPPPRQARTHPASANPRCCSFPLISKSSRLAPRASRQTKHQKPGLAAQEGNPLTWGLSHDPAAPSRHPKERAASGTKGWQIPLSP